MFLPDFLEEGEYKRDNIAISAGTTPAKLRWLTRRKVRQQEVTVEGAHSQLVLV